MFCACEIITGAHPPGDGEGAAMLQSPTLNLNKNRFLEMISIVLRDLPFDLNQPLKSFDG